MVAFPFRAEQMRSLQVGDHTRQRCLRREDPGGQRVGDGVIRHVGLEVGVRVVSRPGVAVGVQFHALSLVAASR